MAILRLSHGIAQPLESPLIHGVTGVYAAYRAYFRATFDTPENAQSVAKATGWGVWSDNCLIMDFDEADRIVTKDGRFATWQVLA